QVIPMAVDRDDGRKVFDFQLPNRLGTSKLLQANADHALDALRVDLRGTTNAMKINATIFLAGLLRLRAHAAFSDYRLDAEFLDDVRLIRLFADRRGWTGGHHAVLPLVFQN